VLEFLKDFENVSDAVFFIPGEKDGLRIEGKNLAEPGEKVEGTELGDWYHIILFKMDEEGNPKNLDMFEGILVRPMEYISGLIPSDWYGVICRKTTTSSTFVQKLFDSLKEVR
jgi:hypothetical protein